MKNKTIMMALVLAAITTGIFAQAKPRTQQLLTEKQTEQMTEIREKYAPAISELRHEIHVLATEQKVLLSSKTINEEAIYANIDQMGEFKANMRKNMLAMQLEMQEICPFDGEQKGLEKGCAVNRRKHINKSRGAQGNGQKMQQNREQAMQYGQGMQNNRFKERNSFAQKEPQHKKNRQGLYPGFSEKLDLNSEQSAQIAEIKQAHFWEIQETKNQLALLNAKSDSPENKLKTIDEISALQTKLAKQEMAVKLATMNTLTEEQRMKVIAMHNGRDHDMHRHTYRHNF